MELEAVKGAFKFVGTKAELEAYLSDEMHEQRKAAEEAFNGMQIL